MAKNLITLAKEATKAQRSVETAKRALAKVKAQKRPRKTSLETAKSVLESAKEKQAAILSEMGTSMAAPTPERVANPANPAAPTTEGTPEETSPSTAVCQVVIAMIVSAHDTYMEALEKALELLERTPNPHVRGYTRSSRVAPYERGSSRFFGRSSGYTETGR